VLAAPLTSRVLRLPGMGNLIGVKSADVSGAGRPTLRGMLELAGRASAAATVVIGHDSRHRLGDPDVVQRRFDVG
jgi:hypothetical protein